MAQHCPLKSEGAPEVIEGIALFSARGMDKGSNPLWKQFVTQCFKMTRHPGKWFVFSIILAAIVDEYVPRD